MTVGNSLSQKFELTVGNGQTSTIPRRSKNHKEKPISPWGSWGLIGDLGFSLALPIAGGAFLGTALDRRWGSYPRATLVLLIVGVTISFVNLFIIVRRVIDDAKRT